MCPKGVKKKLTHNSPVYSLMPERAVNEAKTFNDAPRKPHEWNTEPFGSGLRVSSWFQGAGLAFTN